MEEHTQITINPLQAMCARHGEVFKPRWPSGYPQYAVVGLQALLADEAFMKEVTALLAEGLLAEGTTLDGAVSHLLRKRPLCCRLGADTLYAVYNDVNANCHTWEARHCNLCKRHRPGCAFRRTPASPLLRLGWAKLTGWKHVCLHCVVYGQNGR